MDQKKKNNENLRAIRCETEAWDFLAMVAAQCGMSRSAFVRESALAAARSAASGICPYFVSEAKATPQNTRINLFLTEGKQKLAPGGGQDAADCSRSDGEAKGGPTSDLPVHKLNELTDGKA